MKICEAIKEAYEKARLNKEKQNDGYDYVVPVSDKDGTKRDFLFDSEASRYTKEEDAEIKGVAEVFE